MDAVSSLAWQRYVPAFDLLGLSKIRTVVVELMESCGGSVRNKTKSTTKMFYMGAFMMGAYVLHGCVCNFEVHVS